MDNIQKPSYLVDKWRKHENNPVHKHLINGSYTFSQVLSLTDRDLESYDNMGF